MNEISYLFKLSLSCLQYDLKVKDDAFVGKMNQGKGQYLDDFWFLKLIIRFKFFFFVIWRNWSWKSRCLNLKAKKAVGKRLTLCSSNGFFSRNCWPFAWLKGPTRHKLQRSRQEDSSLCSSKRRPFKHRPNFVKQRCWCGDKNHQPKNSSSYHLFERWPPNFKNLDQIKG